MRVKLLLKALIFLSLSLFTLFGFELPCISQGSLITVKSVPNLYMWTDICNVYVLRDGDKAILIDLGDGSVLSHLSEIGVKQVDWVLFTHHHREQCQGYPLLKSLNVKIAVPKAEKHFLNNRLHFVK